MAWGRKLITGGLAVTVDKAPYVVRLYTPSRGTGFCGGTLLSNVSVLTAAHCVDGYARDLYVGTYHTEIYADTAYDAERGDVVKVSNIVLHPSYKNGTSNAVVHGNDAAVLTLERAPRFFGQTDGPHAVELDDGSFWPASSSDRRPPSDASYVLGYGSDTFGGPQSYYLRAAHVHLFSRTECETVLGFGLAPSNLCAGLDGADACTGDSGGPLIVAFDGRFVQVGIVSWGVGTSDCGDPDAPGIYSTVSSARSFVTAHAPLATFTTHVNVDGHDEDPCACTKDCTSNGFSVEPRCSCHDHVGEGGLPFCYVQHDACTNAVHSTFVFGALYRTCVPLPPPPLPPPLPPNALQPTTQSPLAPLSTCDRLRRTHTDLGCCASSNATLDACTRLEDEFRRSDCCGTQKADASSHTVVRPDPAKSVW